MPTSYTRSKLEPSVPAAPERSSKKSTGAAKSPDDIITWVHFKYVYHDTLPGWAITYHECCFYSGPTLGDKTYIIDAWSRNDGMQDFWAWHSMPVTRADWNPSFGSPREYVHLMPSRILEIDWRDRSIPT